MLYNGANNASLSHAVGQSVEICNKSELTGHSSNSTLEEYAQRVLFEKKPCDAGNHHNF